MKYILITVALIFWCLISIAQSSIFQDSKGESAIKLFGNGAIINTKDQSLSVGIDMLKRSRKAKDSCHRILKRSGFNVKLSANEGIANIKSSDGFLVDGEIGFYKGWKKTSDIHLDEGWTKEWYGSFVLIIDRNKFFSDNRNMDDFTFKKGNLGWKFETGFFGYKDRIIYGASVNFGQQSNIEDLKTRTVANIISTHFNDSIWVSKQESAYDFNQFSKGLWGSRFNVDIAWWLNPEKSKDNDSILPPMYLTLHLRERILESEKPKFNPAIGIYFGKSGAPRSIVAGFNVQLEDLFNVDDSEDNIWKRTVFNFTAGYKF